jgi:hypothetical protein
MSSIRLIRRGFDVVPLLEEIAACPSAWNRHTLRQRAYVHQAISDIWVRYNPWDNFTGDVAAFNGPHESAWYPVADEIPSVKVRGERLGGVLITKIPADQMCKPHRDGGWHATYYEKFAVQLASAPGQAFCFEDARLSAEPGDLYTFDNSRLHWVLNPSTEDRITLIMCIRRSH